MKLAHFGTFDVENYGDLLFPLILERRLADYGDEFIHVSPVGGSPLWQDCVRTVNFDAFLQDTPDIDGVVIGGGHIIRSAPTPLKAREPDGDTTYDRGGISTFLAYPSLWLGAAYIAARHDVPLCWNGPGVFAGFAPVAAELLRWTASVSDYLTVRDEASRRFLEEAGVSQEIGVIPDTALEVSRLWTVEEISKAYAQAFDDRNKSMPGRTLAFHINRHYAGENATCVAARIDRICEKLDATAILIAIGPSHGDSEMQRQVAQSMRSDPLLIDQPQSLREIAACIARSEAYFGSSLHGMITACSFGKRGVLVASEEVAKYAGFLEQFGLTPWLTDSWAEVEQRVDELFATPSNIWERVLETATPTLDRHWARLRTILAPPGIPAREASPRADKRSALEQLKHIGEDRFGDATIFQALIAESLENNLDNQAQLRKLRHELEDLHRTLENVQRLRRDEQEDIRRLHRELEDLKSSRGWKIANGINLAIIKARSVFEKGQSR